MEKKYIKIGVVLLVISLIGVIAIALGSGLGSELMGLGGIGTALGLGFLAQSRDNGSGRTRDERASDLADRREELQGDIEDGNQRTQDRVDAGLGRIERIETELDESELNSQRANSLIRNAIARAKEREGS